MGGVRTLTTGVYRVRTNGGRSGDAPSDALATRGLEWSPDGKTVAFISPLATGERTRRLIIITPGAATRTFGLPTEYTGNLRFTPDGSTIAYPVRKDGGTSIQFLPLDGSAPRLMASADINFDGRVSPDGLKIAVLRQRVDSDVGPLRDGAARER